MGQGEVLEFLEKQKEPVSLSQIYEAFSDINPRAVRNHVASLLKFSEIKCIEIDRHECKKRYKKLSRRMLLYYV